MKRSLALVCTVALLLSMVLVRPVSSSQKDN